MIPELDLPVLAEAEVAVAGAGPAGVAAALAAARSGARVVLLEQTGCCGGMATSGLVPVFIHISDRVHRVASGICYELVSEMCRRMEVPAVDEIWQHIHPEVLKRVCDDKLAEAGVELLLAVKVADVIRSGGRIDALAVATSRGLKKVTASIFVDATGDGLVAAAAGVPFELGDKVGRTMSPSLCVQYSNINLDRMREAERRGEGAGQLWFRYRDEIPLDEYHIAVSYTHLYYGWANKIAPYAGFALASNGRTYEKYAKPSIKPSGNPFVCPADIDINPNWCSYSCNGRMGTNLAGYDVYPVYRIGKYKSPSSKMYLVDGYGFTIRDYEFCASNLGNTALNARIKLSHVNRANVAFLDGHAAGFGFPPLPLTLQWDGESNSWNAARWTDWDTMLPKL